MVTYSPTFTYTPDDNGTYVVSLTVTDNGGLSAISPTVTTQATAVAPSIALSGNSTVNEGSTYTLNLGTITDPGDTDIFTAYDINWGDGSPLQHVMLGAPQTAAAWTGASQTHVYDDGPASESIVVSLEDQYPPYVNVGGSKNISVLNVPPTATFVNFGSVNEGSPGFVEFLNPTDVSSADRTHGFTYSYDFSNDGSFTDPGDIANSTSPSATVPASILNHPGNYTIHGRIIDKDGGFTDYFTTIHVNDVTPIVNLPSSANVNQNTLFTQNGSFVDPGTETWTATVDYGDGSGVQTLTLNPNKTFTLSHTYASVGADIVTVSVTDQYGATGTAQMTVNVVPTTFQVTSFSGNPSGFDVTFDRAANLSILNLYQGGSDSLGLPDVTVTGQHTGTVKGSLVWDANSNTAHFVAFGNQLASDTYTVDLASRSTGWTDTSGSILDGLGTNVAGSGDYVTQFVVAAPTTPVLSLPSFARGPGQDVDVSDTPGSIGTALSQYLPIYMSNTTGVLSVDFVIDYNPAWLTISAAQLGAAAPGTWSVTTNSTVLSPTETQLEVTASGSQAASGSPGDVVDLVASVPSSAISQYGASQLLKLTNVRVNEGNIAAVADEAIEKVAYFGDATGDGSLSGLDASMISRNVVHLDDGFTAYPLTDPRIIADVTGDGTLSGLDASYVSQVVVHLTVPTIPAVPAHGSVIMQRWIQRLAFPWERWAPPGKRSMCRLASRTTPTVYCRPT